MADTPVLDRPSQPARPEHYKRKNGTLWFALAVVCSIAAIVLWQSRQKRELPSQKQLALGLFRTALPPFAQDRIYTEEDAFEPRDEIEKKLAERLSYNWLPNTIVRFEYTRKISSTTIHSLLPSQRQQLRLLFKAEAGVSFATQLEMLDQTQSIDALYLLLHAWMHLSAGRELPEPLPEVERSKRAEALRNLLLSRIEPPSFAVLVQDFVQAVNEARSLRQPTLQLLGWFERNRELLKWNSGKGKFITQVVLDIPRTNVQMGILIFEVGQKIDGNMKAIMRFDSPSLGQPMKKVYDRKSNRIQEESGSLAIKAAMEHVITSLRWETELERVGTIKILERTPENLQEWLSQASKAERWNRRLLETVFERIEREISLGVNGLDADLLLVVGEAQAHDASREGLLDRLRSTRIMRRIRPGEDGRIEIQTSRRLMHPPESQNIKLAYTHYKEPGIFMQVDDLENHSGTSVFDPQTGLLDTLSEQYTVHALYYTQIKESESERQELHQAVNVEYTLRRLAPPIREKEDIFEEP